MLPRAILLLVVFGLQGDKPEVEVVLGPECITEMHATEHTDCRGPALDNLTCKRIVITYRKGCEHINVVQK